VATFDDFFPLKKNEIVTKYSFFKPFFREKRKKEKKKLIEKKKNNISATFYYCSFHEFEKLQ